MRYVIIAAIFSLFVFCFPAPPKDCKPVLYIEFFYKGKMVESTTTRSFIEFEMNRGKEGYNFGSGEFLADSVRMIILK